MLSELSESPSVVGAQQVRRAVESAAARKVFFAEDADPRITQPILCLCEEKGLQAESVPDMKTLGRACGIAVPAAVAALLR